MMMTHFKESPSQTAGPYVHIGCTPRTAGLEQRDCGAELGATMRAGPTEANAICLELIILDGAGDPVRDALVEIWQAGPEGRFHVTEGFHNWGRQAADLDTGRIRFDTLKPGAQTGAAPHILIWIVARGINLGLATRLYFPDEDNETDPIYQLAGDRAATLVAQKIDGGYRHQIILQGDQETVFFDL